MKRGAEKQLSKDDAGSDDENQEESGSGLKKADESVLASRPMRSLPKRSLAGLGAPSAPPSTSSMSISSSNGAPPAISTPTFTGFSSGTSAPFSFSPSSDPSAPSPFSGSVFSSSTPPVASSASNTTKTFAAFLSESSNPAPSPLSTPTPILAAQPTDNSSSENPAIKYYSSLRGLNHSLLAALTKAVDQDPFVDLGGILDQYKQLRNGIKQESEDKPKPPTAIKSFSMPTPPASFGQSDGPTTGTLSTATALPKTGFSFPSSSSTSTGFSFPTSTKDSAPSLDENPSSKTNVFAFGSSSSSAKPFNFGGSSSPPKTGTSSNFFGTSSFTSTSTSENKTTSTFNAFAPVSESPEKSTPGNPFGVSTSTAPAVGLGMGFGGGAFGKKPASGTIGNPVGFAFASPPSTPDVGSSSGSGFPFNSPSKPKEKSDDSVETIHTPGTAGVSAFSSSERIRTEGVTAGTNQAASEQPTSTEGEQAAGTDEQPAPGGLNVVNPHELEGKGEEDEDTVHAIKAKAYRLRTADEKGGAGWLDLGVGILRLKKHKTQSARRMLLRNSSTGRILVNFALYPSLSLSVSGKGLIFIGFEDKVPKTYRIAVGSEEKAMELKEVLAREIAFVKAKSAD
ncbi:hypothetical protein BDQ12DRAFT_672813 [Crucibulum laeve]|uniref:RanBD1 domain-containing protein n=1 Tax=Crucibulum laeve TaxID=68775 RepID=A0A5C3MGH4_9AGAR|nr:hypothetical protein BDQ12DRAFT_672813 [Crucibulum laeve]